MAVFRQGPMYSISSFPTAGYSFPQAKLPPDKPWTADWSAQSVFSEPTHCLVTSGILWTVSPTERWSLELSKFEYWIFFFSSFCCCCSYWTSYFFEGGGCIVRTPDQERRMTITQRGITTWFWTPSLVLDLPSKVWVVVWRRPWNWNGKWPDRFEDTHEHIWDMHLYVFICTHIFHYDWIMIFHYDWKDVRICIFKSHIFLLGDLFQSRSTLQWIETKSHRFHRSHIFARAFLWWRMGCFFPREQWKITWLFRVYRGLHYPLIYACGD